MTDDANTVADTMLDVFGAYGAEYIFSSPGTEYAPLWEAVARARSESRGPSFLDVRHEDTAVSLAIGYYSYARKLPIVALHTGVGTLHGAMALRNAWHERVPMVVLAGFSATYGEAPNLNPGGQWGGVLTEVVGPEGLARAFVKRSTVVPSAEVLPGMLQDACRIALTPPMGPVFLAVPLEYMMGTCRPLAGPFAPPPVPPLADPNALQQVAQDLAQAERPLLMTGRAGKDPRNVALLVELAESLSMPVVEAGSVVLNFPRDHALHQGFESGELLRDADLVLLIAEQGSWYPPSRRPTSGRIVLIDDDPAHELDQYWARGVDQVIAGDLHGTLRDLNERVKRLVAPAYRPERLARLRARHEQQREEWRSQALRLADQKPLAGAWAMAALAEALPSDAIVVSEVLSQRMHLLHLLNHSLPGTEYNPSHGGLGVGLGVALGVKLAAPDRLVVAVEGDGSFNYNPVTSALGFAQQYHAPILMVVMNNQGYAAMKRIHLGYYPDGWAARTGDFPGTDILPSPDYAMIARAFGGYGERVEEPDQVQGALQRAIERVTCGQLALLDLVVDPIANATGRH